MRNASSSAKSVIAYTMSRSVCNRLFGQTSNNTHFTRFIFQICRGCVKMKMASLLSCCVSSFEYKKPSKTGYPSAFGGFFTITYQSKSLFQLRL